MSDLREQIKKQCFGLDDDELDTQIAYRDILDVVGKIEALIQEQVRLAKIDELERLDAETIHWLKPTVKTSTINGEEYETTSRTAEWISDRIKELKK